MKNIPSEFIIKALQLPRIGRKTAFKLFNNLNFSIDSDYDLFNYIKDNTESFKLPNYTEKEIVKSLESFYSIANSNQINDISVSCFYDNNYPELLRKTSDPPIIIYYKGNFEILNKLPSIAIVGTRKPSEYGYKISFRLGEIFGENSFNVISGLAIGCDTGGHTGCLNKAGITTAILAHGLDQIYPKENKSLSENILRHNGLLLSEYSAGQKPLANYFVERDRLQAWLSLGIIVVETDIVGGTMHTVGFAVNENRLLATINHPNDKLNEKSTGNQKLIHEKLAIPLDNSEEINTFRNKVISIFKEKNPSGSLNIIIKDNNGEQLKLF